MKPALFLKTLSVFTVCISLYTISAAQGKPFKKDNDTLYAYINRNGETVPKTQASLIRKWWPEDGKWKAEYFDVTGIQKLEITTFSDKDFKTRDGIHVKYHHNGLIKDSGNYIGNQREGTFRGWHENGGEHHIQHYKKNIPVDTGVVFYDDGKLMQLTITNDDGNGIFQDYYTTNKIRQIGKLQEGKRNGTWIVKRENGTKKMQLEYEADSLIQTFCFEEDGKTQARGECIFEKEPSFPGGVKAWTNFLQRTLNYPDEALNRNIQGVVKVEFTVNKDGSLTDFVILNSPDLSLSREVIRIMSKSPSWEPAVQFNESVKFKHIQAISFYTRRETRAF